MAKQKYLVTGRVFGKNGENLEGKVVEKDKDFEHPCFTKVSATEAKKVDSGKKLEVATPEK